METKYKSIAITNPHKVPLDPIQKMSFGSALVGVLLLLLAFLGVNLPNTGITLTVALSLIVVGTAIYSHRTYMTQPAGIKNNHVWFNTLSNKGVWGWVLGIVLTGFYVLLYWFPEYIGTATGGATTNSGLVALFDPLSMLIKGKPASHWFVYGTMYTLLILALGIKFIYKYRHNKYQIIRTLVVIASQLLLAYLIPEVLEGFNADKPYFVKDLKQIWPLNYYITEEWYLNAMQVEQNVGPSGLFYFFWAVILFLVITPVLTYYVGKRWYCSWVCGCGGLAETAGDPFRQLSSKKLSAWKIERWLIHSIMVFVLVMSVGVFYSYFTGKEWDIALFTLNKNSFTIAVLIFLGVSTILSLIGYLKWSNKNKFLLAGTIVLAVIFAAVLAAHLGGYKEVFLVKSKLLKKWYGFGVGAAFSGVVGVGFYPILGSRVWCRFGCPMAGYMGIIQRFKSRFRITTNGGQCISCGNCSTYCEQGIDVRAYAQKGQNIVRASCVGCGICAAVCPRGVLKLENAPNDDESRMDVPDVIVGNDLDLMKHVKNSNKI